MSNFVDEDITAEQVSPSWFIDLGWYQQSNRSFFALAQNCLCPKCQKSLKGEISAADLVAAIKNCCSKTPGFITKELPILESIFRLLLANGNQPLDLKELGRQLGEQRGDTYRTSAKILSRLLQSDQYYGIRQVEV